MRIRYVLCLSGLLAAQSIFGADIVWTNVNGGNWNAAANWSPNQLPGAPDNAIVTNSGTYRITLNAAATINSLVLGADAGTQTLTNVSQTLTLNGPSVVSSNAVLGLGGGTLTGPGNLTVDGRIIWNAGTISGTGLLIGNGHLGLSGSGQKQLTGRTFVNTGTALWSGGVFALTGTLFSNAPGSTFECAFDGSILFLIGGPGTFANAGTFRKTSGAGTLRCTSSFNNHGMVELQSGTFSMENDGLHSGSFLLSAGTTLHLNGGMQTFGPASSIEGEGNFLINAGPVTMAGLVNIGGAHTFQGGGFQPGSANITGNYICTNNTVNFIGTGTATFNGTGVITPAVLNMSGGKLLGSNLVTVSGPMTWSGGEISGSGVLIANGGVILNSSGQKQLTGRTLINTGAATWSAGQLWVSAAVFSNTPSATFDCTFDGELVYGPGGPGTFVIAGLYRKTAGTATNDVRVTFNNQGRVEVQSGALLLRNGGVHSGEMAISAGSELVLSGGTHAFSAASSIMGGGDFVVNFGTANLAGLVNVTGTHMITGGSFQPGTINVTGNYICTNTTLNIFGGFANFNGTGVIAPAMLNITAGRLAGSNLVTVAGPMTWSGGEVEGPGVLVANGGLILNTSGQKQLTGRTLINTTAATWSAGQLLVSAAVFSNTPSATFDCTFDGELLYGPAGPGTFANAGTWRKTGGTGTNNIWVTFNNHGHVEVQSGALLLRNGGVHAGDIAVSGASALMLSLGTHSFGPASVIAGAGDLVIAQGTANLAGLVNLTGTHTFDSGTANITGNYFCLSNTLRILGGTANFNGTGVIAPEALLLNTGILGGTNPITVQGPMTWMAGEIRGSNSIFANGGLSLNSTTQKVAVGRSLVNAATATWTGGAFSLNNNSVFSNAPGAIFDCAFDGSLVFNGSLGPAGRIMNAGTLRKTAGPGASSVSVAFTNSGTVEVQSGTLNFTGTYTQTDGLTLLKGGNIMNVSPVRLQGGVLEGTNTIFGGVTNNGAIYPGLSPGKLTITGNLGQTTNATLDIELAGMEAGATFDLLVVGGTALLAGTLNATLADNFYPPTNASFTFLTASNRTGIFTTFNYPSNDVGMAVSYTSTNATIQVINVRPVLPPFPNQVHDELVSLTFDASGTDADRPAQTLTYFLTNSPSGATIDPINGLFSWVPTEAQGPLITNVTVVVTDNGTPNLTVSRSFQVTVDEINIAPMLVLPTNPSVNEGTTFNAQATATDSDIPTNPLSFDLLSGPAGLTVSPQGAISWTPGEADGPNTYTIVVRVRDLNTNAVNEQQLSTTNSFLLSVNEVNRAPTLTVPGDQIIAEETPLSVSAAATDPDVPANSLMFSLVSPPAGMNINPTSGAIAWTPTEAQGPLTNFITVAVTDFNPSAVNATSITVTNTFRVIVTESNKPPVLTLPADSTIHATTPFSAAASATDADIPANALAFGLVSGPAGLSVSQTGAIAWTPTDASIGRTNNVKVRVADDGLPSLGATQNFNIIVVSRPLLAPPLLTGSNADLSWSAIAGVTYRLQYNSDLTMTNWNDRTGDVTATGTNGSAVDSIATGANRFYRVRVLP